MKSLCQGFESIWCLLHSTHTFLSLVLETESEGEIGNLEESEMDMRTPTETLPPPSGPSGLVIFGRLVQKHSYVSALIIMMVKEISEKGKNVVV